MCSRGKNIVWHPFTWSVLLLFLLGTEAFAAVFSNPIISTGADPWIIRRNGNYHYTQTTGGGVRVRKAPYLTGSSGIGNAGATLVFSPPAPYNKGVWAPELHFLQGKWYIYYAADDGDNVNHRMFVAEASTGNSQSPYNFKGQITDPTNRWAIDGTVLEMDDGSLYFIWSGWPGSVNGQQNLYIAPMSNPWTISGPRVLISTPNYDWEGWINEGPQIIKRNGKIFIVYSANGSWTDNYCFGLLTNTDGDVLNPASWSKHPQPVFKKYTSANGSVYGPGHGSFTKSVDGAEDWLIYHAAKSSGSGWDRSVRIQPFTWNANDSPFFGTPIPTNIVQNVPSGEGANTLTVQNTPGGAVIRSPHQATYPQNTLVTLTATAAPGFLFIGWQGDATGLTNPLTIKMDANKSVTARFTNELILDNNEAILAGTWSTGVSSLDKFGTDYRFAHWSNTVTHTATYVPSIPVTANYDVFAWYPQGPNRADAVRYEISSLTGTATTNLNQQTGGGGWRLLASEKLFAAGTDGYVRISNQGADSSKVIIADAIRLVLSADQNQLPFITRQPDHWSGAPGGTATFEVEANGTAPFTFQWQFNGTNIAGATGSRFQRSNAQAADAGYYSVQVSNMKGAVSSSSAMLSVELPVTVHSAKLHGNDTMRLTLGGTFGTTNKIEVSTNLVNWTHLTNIVMTGSTVEFLDSTTNRIQRFYRLLQGSE